MSDTSQNAVPASNFLSSLSLRDAGTLIGLIAIVVIFSAFAPDFLSQRNLLNILQQSSINACLALGMTLVIISGGIDLSVGPTAAIAAVISASLLVAGVPVPLAILRDLVLVRCAASSTVCSWPMWVFSRSSSRSAH
jgi:ribose transport system permease protein